MLNTDSIHKFDLANLTVFGMSLIVSVWFTFFPVFLAFFPFLLPSVVVFFWLYFHTPLPLDRVFIPWVNGSPFGTGIRVKYLFDSKCYSVINNKFNCNLINNSDIIILTITFVWGWRTSLPLQYEIRKVANKNHCIELKTESENSREKNPHPPIRGSHAFTKMLGLFCIARKLKIEIPTKIPRPTHRNSFERHHASAQTAT